MADRISLLKLSTGLDDEPYVEIDHLGRTWQFTMLQATSLGLVDQRRVLEMQKLYSGEGAAARTLADMSVEDVEQLMGTVNKIIRLVFKPFTVDCPVEDVWAAVHDNDKIRLINLFGSRPETAQKSSTETTATGKRPSPPSKRSMAAARANGG